MPGEMFGHYRIEEKLGAGAMGEVYRAWDTRRGRRVALKLLPATLAADEQLRRRFRREAIVVAGLADGHVIPVHDHGEIDGRPYIDMRLVEGADLATVLERHGRLSPERAVRITSQVARALDAAHAQDLVHRDVKPSNILLADASATPDPDQEDYTYLADFGIVGGEGSTRLTATGEAVGTLAYMAPERFDAGTAGPPVDVYALGCVLLEMLTGAPPFPREEQVAVMYAHLGSPPPRVSERAPQLRAFDDVVARALAKVPVERFPTAGALAVAAQRALARPAAAPPAPPALPRPAPARSVGTRDFPRAEPAPPEPRWGSPTSGAPQPYAARPASPARQHRPTERRPLPSPGSRAGGPSRVLRWGLAVLAVLVVGAGAAVVVPRLLERVDDDPAEPAPPTGELVRTLPCDDTFLVSLGQTFAGDAPEVQQRLLDFWDTAQVLDTAGSCVSMTTADPQGRPSASAVHLGPFATLAQACEARAAAEQEAAAAGFTADGVPFVRQLTGAPAQEARQAC